MQFLLSYDEPFDSNSALLSFWLPDTPASIGYLISFLLIQVNFRFRLLCFVFVLFTTFSIIEIALFFAFPVGNDAF